MTKIKKIKCEYREEELLNILRGIFYMARRYAHGRHTGAPDTVRKAYKYLKHHYPELRGLEHDVVIERPKEGHGFIRSDWLDDTNKEEK